ncbi:conserved hypothetical protein [Cupriavidus phytorum]|uniref:Uncharacterized protein n=1 Tax=Cupriavidus taiwanensis TaxID=164546 RepID=A0A375C8Y2_9BURK|nr:conserved hypothetical protein [Cupriavidus taiwanensis]
MLSADLPHPIVSLVRDQLRRPNAMPGRRQTLRDAIDRNYQIPHYRGCCKVVSIPLFEWRIAIGGIPLPATRPATRHRTRIFGYGLAFPPSERSALPR